MKERSFIINGKKRVEIGLQKGMQNHSIKLKHSDFSFPRKLVHTET